MSDIQVIRQLLLDLLTEYQQLEKPANPELLRLHIEAYEDRVEALIQEQVRLARIDELEKIASNESMSDDSPMIRSYIKQRIKTLKGE